MDKPAYGPDFDVRALRAALLKLRPMIGSKALLAEFAAAVTLPRGVSTISEAALREFTTGRNSRRWVALSALDGFLRSHRVYGGVYQQAVDAETFAASVAGFFTDARLPPTFVSPASLRLFEGRFVLYRPDWSARHGAGFYRVSLLEIVASDNGFMHLTETQDFPDESPPEHQTAIGTLFPYGPFAYFLLREEEPAGRRVMFGGFRKAHPVPDLVPSKNSLPVQWFSGFVDASSGHGISAREPFVCRRLEACKRPVRFGVMKLNDAKADPETEGLLKQRPDW